MSILSPSPSMPQQQYRHTVLLKIKVQPQVLVVSLFIPENLFSWNKECLPDSSTTSCVTKHVEGSLEHKRVGAEGKTTVSNQSTCIPNKTCYCSTSQRKH